MNSSYAYSSWHYRVLKRPIELSDAFRNAEICSPVKSVGFDTESTGLHIIKDRPFLFQLGWGREVYMFPPTPDFMEVVFRIFERVNYVFAWNIKYDLNMLCNLGYRKRLDAVKGWCDGITVARLALEAKTARFGGDKMSLKWLGVKYIDPYANNSEKMIDEAMSELNKHRVKILAVALKQFPIDGEFTDSGRQKFWGKGAIEKFLKDPTNDVDLLPEGIQELWKDWQEEYPEPTYADIDMGIMYKYAGEDIATMMMLMERFFPTLVARDQLPVLRRESELILPVLDMERVGLEADLPYLEESRLKVQNYIKELRSELCGIAGFPITVNQHARIRSLFDERWNIVLDSADKTSMAKVMKNFPDDNNGEPARFAKLVNALRTAEKWYSTYIKRIQKSAEYDGRAYTQINLSGAISGRMSSDFQQFPKGALKNIDSGEELFNPRRAFKVGGRDEKGEYMTVYIDYDQIELVVQAHYCVILGSEGTNLARAYMPYKCVHKVTGQEYDYHTIEGRARWNEKMSDGTTVWAKEDGSDWERTDLHSLTTSMAFPDVDPSSDYFKKKLRGLGKRANFASNYGGKEGALIDDIDIDGPTAKKLVEGYNKAYPEVIHYQNMISLAHKKKGYLVNQMGRRYYLQDNRDAYKLANACVQGSCADALKKAIIEMGELLRGYDSCMIMPIHDEQSFKIYKHEEYLIPQLLNIMQSVFTWCVVPVTAGVEVSTTYWSDKKDMEVLV